MGKRDEDDRELRSDRYVRERSPIRRREANLRDSTRERSPREYRNRERSPREYRHRARSPRDLNRERSPQRSSKHSYSDKPSDKSSEKPANSSSERSSKKKKSKKAKIDLESVAAPLEDEMMKRMGFAGFDTTKNKKVDGNAGGTSRVNKPRKYRQYMNRKGGFNRPLDFIA